VHVYAGERVTEVTKAGVQTHSGRFIPSELVVWAAGIKAPDFLNNIDGLETNRINQLVVKTTLQTTLDENVSAFGHGRNSATKSAGSSSASVYVD
jgi:NADH dehydrogenase